MGGHKPASDELEKVGFFQSLMGLLDIMHDDARRTAEEQKKQWKKVESELDTIEKKMALVEQTLIEERQGQARALAAILKEFEILHQSPPALRKESFTRWWKDFDDALQKLADIIVHFE